MTIQTEAEGIITLDSKMLRAAPYTFDSPFQLVLAEGQILTGTKIARLIPGKRMVVFGSWLGRPVVAKLFFDPRHAKRHMRADADGMKILQLNKVPAPELFYEGQSEDQGVYVIIYEEIKEAVNLEYLWKNRLKIFDASKNATQTNAAMDDDVPHDIESILKNVIIELATQHVLGIEQKDLHLKNFLVTEKHIYTIDGGQIAVQDRMLNKVKSMENLALLLSQLGIGVETLQEQLFKHYANARGWLLKQDDYPFLNSQITRINLARWHQFEKKIFRNCTDFSPIQQSRFKGMYSRPYLKPNMLRFMKDPESFFLSNDKQMLKSGRSATVIKVMMDGQEMVIKRYNMKSFWHFLRRCLRPTRAETCWRIAQKLSLFGIPTAKPIAYLEKRFLGLRSTSYYVSEYISGGHVGEFFAQEQEQDVMSELIKRMAISLRSLARLEITHGDLKITNFLLDKNLQPILIDLDGAVEHASISGLRKTWNKEIRRFLRNFENKPALIAQFEEELNVSS